MSKRYAHLPREAQLQVLVPLPPGAALRTSAAALPFIAAPSGTAGGRPCSETNKGCGGSVSP